MIQQTEVIELDATLWDTAETAKNLRTTERTLYNWTASGALKCVRFPNRVMYRPRDVKAFLDDLQANPIPARKREQPIVRKPKRGGRRNPKPSAELTADHSNR